MRILVSNDDGIHAPGLKILEKVARSLTKDVWVVAPEYEQSGASHSLTLTLPLRLRKINARKYAVRGTPTDCVMMAMHEIFKDKRPDLLLSGVNRGANLGEDVTYSGTVSAAMEGAIAGVRSIALSQVYAREGSGDSVPFDVAEAWGPRVLDVLLGQPETAKTLINVNFPALPADQIKGMKVARQGFYDVDRTRIVKATDPRGYDYFWFGLHHSDSASGESDLAAVAEGYVSITPLHFDLTHEASLAALDAAFDAAG